MSTPSALLTAVTFVWLGMVLAISFLEAPLKFRAPGITLPLGLGIGRLVFRALNSIELAWSLVVIVCLVWGAVTGTTMIALIVAMAALAGQVLLVRPRLTRRTDAVLAGEDTGHRSRAHLGYVALEGIKVVALIVAGVALLT